MTCAKVNAEALGSSEGGSAKEESAKSKRKVSDVINFIFFLNAKHRRRALALVVCCALLAMF